MDRWDWTFNTGSGLPDSFEPIRKSPILTQTSDSGYVRTRAKWPRNRWGFKFSFDNLLPECMIYVVNFFDSHKGGITFYFNWYMGLYGLPLNMGVEVDLTDPFTSNLEIGFGEGPWHIVQFVNNELQLKKMKGYDLWLLTSPLEVSQL